jgi:hypothetical protein
VAYSGFKYLADRDIRLSMITLKNKSLNITSHNRLSSQQSITASWADSYILSIIAPPLFSHRLDRSLIGFAVIKNRSFNK